jgi:hypothetical protein
VHTTGCRWLQEARNHDVDEVTRFTMRADLEAGPLLTDRTTAARRGLWRVVFWR